MGARYEVITGDLAHPVERDVVTGFLQLLDHQLTAAESRIGQALQLRYKLFLGRVYPIGEDVETCPVVLGGELQSRDYLQTGAGGRGVCLGQTVGGVVVGDSQAVQTALESHRHVFRHRAHAGHQVLLPNRHFGRLVHRRHE
jgi:hypothetical protein